ncbi:MAG: T9SS type A sorting domain-containing protein [Ignavibacteria bacterium]|nr:T9SS type A sorting domain-containing protein [Ignavibacteria bacterium]
MKTLTSFILAFLAAGIFNTLSAQSLQIVGDANVTVKVETGVTADVQATVKNISAQPVKVHVLRENVSLTKGHDTYFCWIKCYDSSIYHSPLFDESPITLAAGESTDVFHAYINPKIYDENGIKVIDTVEGISIIRYRFYNEDNELDETILTVTFHMGEVSSVEVDYPNSSKASATPNPAQDMTVLTYTAPADFRSGTVNIVDAQGKACGSVPAGESSARIPTAHLPSGVYSYAVTSERGTVVARGQFVVAR